MHHWYYTSAALGISLLFLVQNVAAIAFLYALWLQCGRPELPSFDEDVDYGARDGDDEDEDDGGLLNGGDGGGGVDGMMAEPGEDKYQDYVGGEEDVHDGEDDDDEYAGEGDTATGATSPPSSSELADAKH
uniref:Uncharacterized protein n=1 Tax=Lotharella oceanica TaxID=641309 RepID=A0A7S2TV68_9EUKA|mmetsp:Transcript_31359/g.58472  ORF Transcript_31359/g.58472 Transcript_31359/m.58472 type:complete len:131 (+) Transcript_31359:162-554(+)|eukprot:CAMPEP_0170198674 /NCGR_PEP_ID=MMETSP0040_2-20121228/68911_1 /TAXON_ID=641309 /ORGANISM="Lotharella oceanica, Strain CCMP622" /LENGTH=130 /DNA_ID=CAMNT_0010448703 /DNA_START=1055 /DNA_END=1447 /DNA_ORIENTATION=-